MPAFRRRTSFATPLIITVAASCSKGEQQKPPPHNPPDPRVPDPKPQPTPEPPKSEYTQIWHVTAASTGDCEAEPRVECPPEVDCNPPAPQVIRCPPDIAKGPVQVGQRADKTCAIVGTTTVVDCPLPYGQTLMKAETMIWTVVKKGKACEASGTVIDCPPKKECASPRSTIACPPGVTATKSVRIIRTPSSDCARLPDGCDAASCAGESIACP